MTTLASIKDYVESKKMIQITYLQNRNRLTDFEIKFMITREEGGA